MPHDITTLTNPLEAQPLFKAAVTELLGSVLPFLEAQATDADAYARLERLLQPERVISFKVVWEDDTGMLQHNRGYRVQFNAALGPYKGGLRFDPSVNEDVLKFLGFEQIFKNALTGLPLGGGKGGSDFDPKGKSDAEIRRFCVAFMTELARHIGANTDVPAGDIGVGGREIGYLYGAYKRLMNRTDGTLTGKGVGYGGSYVRTEATGYGAVYFIQEMLTHAGKELRGMRAVISGSGNVATHVALKLLDEDAVPLTLSDRGGYLHAPEGLSKETIRAVQALKEKQGALSELVLPPGTTYHEGTPWRSIKADLYIPSATQHELSKEDAEAIIAHGAILVAEGANMPTMLEGIGVLQKAGILFGPAKAVNAGGVAVSGLEMAQNAGHVQWTAEEVDAQLRDIMKKIHETCVHYGAHEGGVNYVKGANIGGFIKVFDAMKHLGW
jgi:glutamate dehydrogenase (NADP+)